MALPDQVCRYMSLRAPQKDALQCLHDIGVGLDYKTASLEAVAYAASSQSQCAKPVEFDTEFPSFCFALATGVGKTRLMGADIYYLWKEKQYRNFFILAPGMTIYDKLRAELNPAHPKYMFVGLSDFPSPEVYDGDNYLRFNPAAGLFEEGQARVFVFNIGKIFAPKTDKEFKFHRFNEHLGNSFSAMLQEMDDLVVLMDESHRYRAPASLAAITHLKPVLGLEYTATPKYEKNVVYSYTLAQAIGHYIKTPTIVTRTNLTTSDEQEIEKLKLLDGMARHELKKGRLTEHCEANDLPLVKPFVLVSTKDTKHAAAVRGLVESDSFCDGRYKDKVIEIHSKQRGAESDQNVQRLLSVEQPTSNVEVVVHVNMLKEGWDVKNLYTIIPLRASISEILTEQTIGRGLRLPFGELTGDTDLDALEIVSHDQYKKLIEEAKDSPLFKFKELGDDDLKPVQTVKVSHGFVKLEKVIERLAAREGVMFTSDLTDEERLNDVVKTLVAEETEAYARRKAATVSKEEEGEGPQAITESMFPTGDDEPEIEEFDPDKLAAELKELLKNYAHASIDVPRILTDTRSDKKLLPFDIKVGVESFELVEQHVLTRELASGKEKEGERLEVMDLDNPRAFLAGRLIDTVEEMDVENDKDTALKLVDKYIAQMGKPDGELGKIAHLYRDLIIADIRKQIESHLEEETEVEVYVKSGFVPFKPYSKMVLAKEGVVDFKKDVPKADTRRYLFSGFRKSLYPQVPFDSAPEKDLAAILERDGTVQKWIRPPDNSVPIGYRGRNYNPDFIVETGDAKYLLEVKGRRDLEPKLNDEVSAKALAAIRWCEEASKIKGSKPWSYKLIPAEAIESTRDLKFIMGHAVKVE